MRFRDHHMVKIMEESDRERSPFDRLVHRYFRTHKSLGAKDRHEIGNTVFDLMRWRGLLEKLGGSCWEERLLWWRTCNPWKLAPDHIDALFASDFVQLIGKARALELARISNTPAPVTIRANTLKTTRMKLLKSLSQKYACQPCKLSDVGIQFEGRPQLMGLPQFREGHFELQDEASQLLIRLVDARPGQQVLDYCAGAGGKSLGLAAEMGNGGQLYLHDVRQKILGEARRRLRRAGVQNAQFCLPRSRGSMNRILVDAPCTGSGTWRRNVDMKWRFTRQDLDELIQLQRKIFGEALAYLDPGGQIVYATCSVLDEENLEQAEHFCQMFGLRIVEQPFASEPQVGGMDGMFGVVLAHR